MDDIERLKLRYMTTKFNYLAIWVNLGAMVFNLSIEHYGNIIANLTCVALCTFVYKLCIKERDIDV